MLLNMEPASGQFKAFGNPHPKACRRGVPAPDADSELLKSRLWRIIWPLSAYEVPAFRFAWMENVAGSVRALVLAGFATLSQHMRQRVLAGKVGIGLSHFRFAG